MYVLLTKQIVKFYLSANKNIFSKKVLALYFSEREADFSETVQPFLKIFSILLLKYLDNKRRTLLCGILQSWYRLHEQHCGNFKLIRLKRQ